MEENEIDTEVRNAVLDYMEQEGWNPEFYQVNEWENSSVKKLRLIKVTKIQINHMWVKKYL